MKLHYPAQWYDGQSAAAHEIEVHTHADALQVQSHSHQLIARWPLDQVRCTEELYGDQALRLTCQQQPDARLIVQDADFAAWLRGRIPGYHGARDRHALGLRLGVALACLIIVVVGAVYLLPKASGPLTALVPQSWEHALGDHVVELLLADERECRGDAGEAAINALMQQLTQAQGLERMVQIHVLQDANVNALATPGRHVIVFSGLIDQAESPTELAAVLAHELAHVTQRHVMQGLIRDLGMGLVLSAAIGDVSTLAALAADAGRLMISLSYSRASEAEADRIAYATLRQAGISGAGMQAFFERMANATDQVQAPAFLSTHPQPAQRALSFAQLDGQQGLTAQQWQAVQQLCAD